MTLPIIVDGIKCEGDISFWNWNKSLISMIFHPNNSMKWVFFRFKNITHPNYDKLYIDIKNIDWETLWKKSSKKFLNKKMRG